MSCISLCKRHCVSSSPHCSRERMQNPHGRRPSIKLSSNWTGDNFAQIQKAIQISGPSLNSSEIPVLLKCSSERPEFLANFLIYPCPLNSFSFKKFINLPPNISSNLL